MRASVSPKRWVRSCSSQAFTWPIADKKRAPIEVVVPFFQILSRPPPAESASSARFPESGLCSEIGLFTQVPRRGPTASLSSASLSDLDFGDAFRHLFEHLYDPFAPQYARDRQCFAGRCA